MSDPKARPPKDQATSKRAGLSVHHWALIGLILICVAGFWLGRVSLPFGIQMPERLMIEDHRHSWDPHERLVVEGIGFGTILSEVEIRELDGPIVFAAQKVEETEINTPLDFGQRYRLSVEAERPWLGQKIHQDVAFETARIPHIEDLVFDKGSQGIADALAIIQHAVEDTAKTTTLNWDGKPAIIWGRKPDGTFVLTDKSGFHAKGYNGLATSPVELAQIMTNRGGDRGDDRGGGDEGVGLTLVPDVSIRRVPEEEVSEFGGGVRTTAGHRKLQ